MNLKSSPSEPAGEIKMTLTLSPFLLAICVADCKSSTLDGDKTLSPVIIIYFAGIVAGEVFL